MPAIVLQPGWSERFRHERCTTLESVNMILRELEHGRETRGIIPKCLEDAAVADGLLNEFCHSGSVIDHSDGSECLRLALLLVLPEKGEI